MTDTFIEFQKRLNARLPDQIKTVWEDYLAFCHVPAPDEAKAFSAHQQACKNALAHVLILIKLAAMTEPPSDRTVLQTDWIRAAQNALNQTEEIEDDD